MVDAPLILFTRHATSLTASKLMERYNSNRGIQDRYIPKIKNPLSRLRLRLSAQSMNIYYTATSLADDHSGGHRLQALGMALASALLDPTYEIRNKAGLLLRLLLGKRIMNQLHHRRKPLPAGRSTP